MKLLQLRYVLAIADNGLSVTAAANQLYTSQPGVSKQLKLLEEELGLQLFIRNGKSLIGVTTAGDRVIVHARVIMREVEGIRGMTRELVDEGRGSRDPLANDPPHVAAVNRTDPMRHKYIKPTRKRPF